MRVKVKFWLRLVEVTKSERGICALKPPMFKTTFEYPPVRWSQYPTVPVITQLPREAEAPLEAGQLSTLSRALRQQVFSVVVVAAATQTAGRARPCDNHRQTASKFGRGAEGGRQQMQPRASPFQAFFRRIHG